MELGDSVKMEIRRLVSQSAYFQPYDFVVKLVKTSVSELAFDVVRDSVNQSIGIWEGVINSIQTYGRR